MKRILIIEDDRLIGDVYRGKFRAAGFAVDVAANGKSGLESFARQRPDLVMLDLMLPEINGVEVLKTIRSQVGASELPIYVFSNAYLGGMVQAAWEAGATQVLTKATHTPNKVVELIKAALGHSPTESQIQTDSASPRTAEVDFQKQIQQVFLESFPGTLSGMRRQLAAVAKSRKDAARLHELYRKAHPLTANAAMAGLPQIAQIAAAFEALLKNLCDKPEHITASTLRTVAQAIDALGMLFKRQGAQAAAPVEPKILAVDDDEFALRAISCALQKVNLQATCSDNPMSALKLLVETKFDLIFLDVEMPDINGFEFCSKLRSMPTYKKTPVIFLTLSSSLESRAESVLSGGDDFITKPFLYVELAVKALALVLTGSVRPARPASRATDKSSKPGAEPQTGPRRGFPSLKNLLFHNRVKG